MNHYKPDKNIDKEIIKRISNKFYRGDFFNVITHELSLSDLTSLLLEVYRERTQSITCSKLLTIYNHNRFVKPAKLNPLTRIDFEKLAFSLLPQNVEILDLSPVTALGTSSVMAKIDQNNILTALRGTEVVSDSTNVLALECARRKIIFTDSQDITLCSSHRLLRTQLFNKPDCFAHFLILSLATSGKDQGSYKFEYNSLILHLNYYLSLMENLPKIHLEAIKPRLKLIYYSKQFMTFFKPMLSEYLENKCPQIIIQHEMFAGDQSYYLNLRYQLYASNKHNREYFLLDGGFTNWMQNLLNNKKERFLISGLGAERLLTFFR